RADFASGTGCTLSFFVWADRKPVLVYPLSDHAQLEYLTVDRVLWFLLESVGPRRLPIPFREVFFVDMDYPLWKLASDRLVRLRAFEDDQHLHVVPFRVIGVSVLEVVLALDLRFDIDLPLAAAHLRLEVWPGLERPFQ